MIIDAQGLSKSYHHAQQTLPIIRGLNLQVEKGQTLAVIGESGAGKSTLLSLLAGLDTPDEGLLSLTGQRLDMMDENQMSRFRSKHVGIVFQDFHLLKHLNAMENIELPLKIKGEKDTSSKVNAALNDVGLVHRATHFPNQMSGGEQQRVAIARALITEPDIILADEPSGNLDVKTGNHVMDLFFNLVKKTSATLVLVTHNPTLAARCDRRVSMVDGSLFED